VNHRNSLDILPGVRWSKKFGSSWTDRFCSVCETSDSGYILLGGLSATGHYGEVCLVKTDKDGKEEWQNYCGEPGDERLHGAESILQTSDGGYIFCGESYYNETATPEIWVVKTDVKGNAVWNKRYGPGVCNSIYSSRDGGYILTGSTYSPIDPFSFNPVCLLKTDKDGNEVWRQTYWGDSNNKGQGMCVDETINGGYIIAGWLWHNYSGGFGYLGFLLKTNTNGLEHWNKTFTPLNWCYLESVHQTPDEGFIVGGVFYVDTGWLVKTDAYGNELWNKTYTTPTKLMDARAIDLTTDGGFVITGQSNGSANAGLNSCIIKTDASGNKEWQIDMDELESGWTDLGSIQQTSDGGYIAAGGEYGLLVKVELFENSPPPPPTITGPKKGIPNIPVIYTAVSTDPDGDNVSYFFDWGYSDIIHSRYVGWSSFGKSVSRSYTYPEKGSYQIRVKAMDEHYVQSDWTTIEVSMPYSYVKLIPKFFDLLFQRFPTVFPLLRQQMG